MTEIRERSVDFGGFHSRALQQGEPRADRPTVVCFHGWGDCAEAFLPMFEALHDLDTQLVSLDFPGFGQAQRLADGPQLPQFVAFADAAIEHYSQSGRVLPVGQSLGARAALTACSRRQSRDVAALLAIGPAPLELPGWQKVLVRNRSLAHNVSALAATADDDVLRAEMLKSYQRTSFFDPGSVPATVYSHYLKQLPIEHARHHIDALWRFGTEIQEPLELSGVHCPVTILWGKEDRIAPWSGAKHYQAALPAAKLLPLERCGHHAHIEKPAACAAGLRELYDAALQV